MDREEIDTELQHVFRRSWQYVGHTGDLAAGGGWFPGRLAGTPVLVTRDDGGRIRALAAVCRHQGAAINPPAGAGATVRCAYHRWAYRLDGALASAPGFDRRPGFDPAARALPELPVATWGPLVLASADAAAPPFAAARGDLPDRLGIDVAALRFGERRRARLPANWKRGVEDALAHGARLLFPATTVEVLPGRVEIGAFLPAGPDATERLVDTFRAPGAGAEPAHRVEDEVAGFRRRLRAALDAR